MHWLTRIAIKNRWITFLVVIVVVAVSITATLQMQTEYIPDFNLPYIAVSGLAQGSSPEDAMKDIAIPVEDELRGISGLKHIQSTSSEGQVLVFAEFDYGTNMDKIAQEIEKRLSQHDNLNDLLETEQLAVVQIDLEEMTPVLELNMSSSKGLTAAEVRELAEELAAETRQVDGLLRDETPTTKAVEITGGDEDVLIIPQAEAMDASGVSFSWIVSTVQAQTGFASLQAIEETPLIENPSITIGDVAEVAAPVPAAYTNGDPSVNIKWQKAADANTVDVGNALMSVVRNFEKNHAAEGVGFTIISDESETIENSINGLVRDALIGLVLASLVVLVFLWAFKASLIVIVTIPVSILIAFLLMSVFGITINILTLGGMAIAVGRVVDDSIVSLENIYRHLQRGEGFRQAALTGVREVAMPITSATLATVAIFLPMIFVGGIVGELFRPFALTVTFAFLASLVIALVLVPPLASFISGSKGKAKFEADDNWYTRAYTGTLRWCLKHRAPTLGIALAIFIGSLMLISLLDTAFLPSSDADAITVEIEMPHANNNDIAAMVGSIEEQILVLDRRDGEIESYYSTLGNASGLRGNGAAATITIRLEGGADNEQQADALQALCDPLIESPADKIRVTAGSSQGQSFSSNTLQIDVIGRPGVEKEILEEVTALTRQLTKRVQQLEASGKITDLSSDLVLDQTSAAKAWEEDKLAEYAAASGMTAAEMTQQLESEWALMRFGWPIGQLEQQSPTVPVDDGVASVYIPGVVRSLDDLDEIGQLWIGIESPTKLGDLADVSWQPQEYYRAEGGYAGTIEATIVADDVGAVTQEVQQIIDEMELPAQVSEVTMGGVAEQMSESFSQMILAIALAIIIAYLILLVSFRSWLTPIIIMCSLPMAVIGMVIALLVSGNALGISAMMGIMMLIGIVLTNAIVLLTFVEDRRKEGAGTFDALMDAGRVRLRPILMTSITTMIALVPLSLGIGEGELIAAELGVVVIGGLFSSTFLTLLLIPVLYSLTERFRRKPKVS